MTIYFIETKKIKKTIIIHKIRKNEGTLLFRKNIN